MKRADGFTDEQAGKFCGCDLSPHTTGPDEYCPLHGRYDVVWEVAYLSERGLALIDGAAYSSESHTPADPASVREALKQAEARLAELQPEYEGVTLFLTTRLILPDGEL